MTSQVTPHGGGGGPHPAKAWAALLLVAVVAATGPAGGETTPSSQAKPRAFDPDLLENGDLIRYRNLARDDFRADDPPGEIAHMHAQLGAATCVFIATDPEMAIRASGPDAERGLVHARVEKLGFLAFMDRECSWWNPAPVSLPAEYILQHEQIHFALFEVAARRLNRRTAQLADQFQSISTSQQGAVDELRRRLDAELQAAVDEALRRSKALDDETSRALRQDRQEWWWRSVSEELEQLGVAPHRR